MQIRDVATPGLVHCQNRLDLTEKGCFVSVEYGSNGAELNFARDGVKKRVALNVENVHAKRHVTVMLQDKPGTCTGLKGGTCWEWPFVVFPLMAATLGP